MILSGAPGDLGLFASSVRYRIGIMKITDIGSFICSLFKRYFYRFFLVFVYRTVVGLINVNLF